MKAYFITHKYLNTMQKGVQSSHVLAEMFTYYNDIVSSSPTEQLEWEILDTWAREFKTVLILDGGSGEKFDDWKNSMKYYCPKLFFPYATFREPDIEDLCLAFGFILPHREYLGLKGYDGSFLLVYDMFVESLEELKPAQ